MKFKLVNVGRSKATREVDLKDPKNLLIEVRKHLMSRDIDIYFEEDGSKGTVYVGGIRPVGTIECLDDETVAWAKG